MKAATLNKALRVLSSEFKAWERRKSAFRANKESLAKGLSVSKRALEPADKLEVTPWMANMMKQFDPSVDPNKLLVTQGELKAEKFIEGKTLELLNKYVGEEKLDYDRSLPIDHPTHYSVDCWRNFKKGVGLRHVTVESNEKIKTVFDPFKKPFNDKEYSLEFPDEFEFGLEILDKYLPSVKADTNLRQVSLPFQNKDSNTGYPFFTNDRKKDPKTGKTYGQLAMDMAASGSTSFDEASMFPYIGFKRLMRGKTRPIIGSSRVFNVLANRLVAPMIELYKTTALFSGFLDSQQLKLKMVELGDWVLKHNKGKNADSQNYIMVENRDYSAYDTTIKPHLRMWMLAFDAVKNGKDKLTQDCVKLPVFSALRASIINNGNVDEIYGRILSGELRTNLDGSKINALITFNVLKAMDSRNCSLVHQLLGDLKTGYFFMGDDNLTTYYNKNVDKFTELAKTKFGTVVHPDKGEFALFFLQRRVFKRTPASKWIMVTPFTRIIRSLIYRERPTGLGAAGWIIMAWSLLYQLIEWPELMLDIVKLLMPYDKYSLGADLTLDQLIKLLKDEDSKASQEGKSTTLDKLNDGDPIKQGFYDQIAQGSKDGYLSTIHRLIRTLKTK